MAIGDFLSEEQRRVFFREQFHTGRVLYLDCQFTTPPRQKYAIVCCVKPEPHLLLINSQINAFKQSRPHLRELQLAIPSVDHDFLDYDSYVDCSNAIRAITAAAIEDQVVRDFGRLKSIISNAIKVSIIEKIKIARTISPIERNAMLSELES